MDFQASFNSRPRWSVFLPSPDGKSIYIYKALTLGNHLAEDYIWVPLPKVQLRLNGFEFRRLAAERQA
jgi:hypothetical protein